jgi:hypothetical protein
MKQLLVIAVALASVNAFATRARVIALGNSAHLVDTATVYNNPADIYRLGSDYVTFETGATQGTPGQTAQNANAEGMIVRTHGDAKLGLSLGHQTPNVSSWSLRSQATQANLRVNQQNPLELTYGMKNGDISYAGTLVYSNYHNKQAAVGVLEKESSTGLRLGAVSNGWDAALRLGLSSNAQLNTGHKLDGTTAIGLSGGYWMDSVYLFGNFSSAGIKEQTNAGVETLKYTATSYTLGALSSMKKDGSELFYSASLVSSETKDTVANTKTTSMSLPLLIGLELDAASWLTLRGSISQSTLIANSKTETAGTTTAETAPGVNNTTLALGAGLKFNKVTFDGTLATATTQQINTTNLLAQAGLTYTF